MDRAARDTERGRELVQAHLLAGAELTADQPLLDRLVDDVVQVRAWWGGARRGHRHERYVT